MNWGNRLLLLFVGFAALIATLVYKSFNTKYELVSKDYYKDELRYQEQIDGAANAVRAGNIAWHTTADSLFVQLPPAIKDASVQGMVWLYYATDASLDRRFAIDGPLSGRGFAVPAGGRAYEFRLQFRSGETPYYYTVNINP